MRHFILVGVFTLLACGKSSSAGSGSSQGQLGSKAYVVLNETSLERTDASLNGSGQVAFKDPIGGIGANKNYVLTFTLSDGGSVTLITNADESLKNGVEVKFSRSGPTVSAIISVAGTSTAAKTLSAIDATQTITLAVDVHNSESPAHVMIWSDANASANSPTVDSESEGATSGQGRGTYWGLQLKGAQVTAANIGSQKFTE